MNMSMSNERLNEIHEHVRDAFRGLEVKGDTDMAEIVVRADMPDLMAEVKRLREALTITDEMVERGALALADEEKWPTNEELGGGLTGTRDDELRDSCRDEVRRILEAALGVEE